MHVLKEERGATLEVVVSRMKLNGSNVRFVALSATVPNSRDIAAWLGKNHHQPDMLAHEERFGEEFRPVKLEKYVYAYQSGGNDFTFDKLLGDKLPEVIMRHGSKKPVMVFCATRASCQKTAKLLAEKWQMCSSQHRPWHAPRGPFTFNDKELQGKFLRKFR